MENFEFVLEYLNIFSLMFCLFFEYFYVCFALICSSCFSFFCLEISMFCLFCDVYDLFVFQSEIFS